MATRPKNLTKGEAMKHFAPSTTLTILLLLTLTFAPQSQAWSEINWVGHDVKKLTTIDPDASEEDRSVLEDSKELVAIINADTNPDQPQHLYLTYDNTGHLTGIIRLDKATDTAYPHEFKGLEEGIVFMKSGKKEVLKLVGKGISRETGGEVELIYLTNGISNRYKKLPLKFSFADRIWQLQALKGKKGPWGVVETLEIKGRRIFGRVIGIASITPTFDPE